MGELLPRLLAIGAHDSETEDARLRRVLLLTAALMVMPAAVLWGGIYWWFGEELAAL